MSTNGKIDFIIDEIDALRGSMSLDTTMRLLLERWRRDLVTVANEIEDFDWDKNELTRIRQELTSVYDERNALKSQVASLRAISLRSGEFFKRINQKEYEKLQDAGRLDEFLLELENNQLIPAIKLWRSVFPCGLKEGKDRVEEIRGRKWNESEGA